MVLMRLREIVWMITGISVFDVSGILFARSSEKLNNWFINTKLYKYNYMSSENRWRNTCYEKNTF